MITLESKMKLADKAMNDAGTLKVSLLVFADLIDKSVDETKELIATSEDYMSMFQKFTLASVVSMVCDKAAKAEAEHA